MLDSELRIAGGVLLNSPVFGRFHQRTAKGDLGNWGARASHHDLHISLQPTPSPIYIISGEENKFSKLFVKIYPTQSNLKLVSKFSLTPIHAYLTSGGLQVGKWKFVSLFDVLSLPDTASVSGSCKASAGGEGREKDDKASPASLNAQIMWIEILHFMMAL